MRSQSIRSESRLIADVGHTDTKEGIHLLFFFINIKKRQRNEARLEINRRIGFHGARTANETGDR